MVREAPPPTAAPEVETPTVDDGAIVTDETPQPSRATAEPSVDNTATVEPDTDAQNLDTAVRSPQPTVAAPPDEEAAIRAVLETFEVAIETMNMALYRSVRPSLSADEASRVRAGFEAVQSHQVDLTILSIAIQDTEAVVRLSRRDTIQTGGGEHTQESRQTVALTKTPDGWVIAQMGG